MTTGARIDPGSFDSIVNQLTGADVRQTSEITTSIRICTAADLRFNTAGVCVSVCESEGSLSVSFCLLVAFESRPSSSMLSSSNNRYFTSLYKTCWNEIWTEYDFR